MSLEDVAGVTSREAINGYGIMARSGPEVMLHFLVALADALSASATVKGMMNQESRAG